MHSPAKTRLDFIHPVKRYRLSRAPYFWAGFDFGGEGVYGGPSGGPGGTTDDSFVINYRIEDFSLSYRTVAKSVACFKSDQAELEISNQQSSIL